MWEELMVGGVQMWAEVMVVRTQVNPMLVARVKMWVELMVVGGVKMWAELTVVGRAKMLAEVTAVNGVKLKNLQVVEGDLIPDGGEYH